MGRLVDHEHIGPKPDRNRWIADLERLPLAADGADAFRRAGRQQGERPLEINGVSHVEQSIRNGGSMDGEHAEM